MTIKPLYLQIAHAQHQYRVFGDSGAKNILARAEKELEGNKTHVMIDLERNTADYMRITFDYQDRAYVADVRATFLGVWVMVKGPRDSQETIDFLEAGLKEALERAEVDLWTGERT